MGLNQKSENFLGHYSKIYLCTILPPSLESQEKKLIAFKTVACAMKKKCFLNFTLSEKYRELKFKIFH